MPHATRARSSTAAYSHGTSGATAAAPSTAAEEFDLFQLEAPLDPSPYPPNVDVAFYFADGRAFTIPHMSHHLSPLLQNVCDMTVAPDLVSVHTPTHLTYEAVEVVGRMAVSVDCGRTLVSIMRRCSALDAVFAALGTMCGTGPLAQRVEDVARGDLVKCRSLQDLPHYRCYAAVGTGNRTVFCSLHHICAEALRRVVAMPAHTLDVVTLCRTADVWAPTLSAADLESLLAKSFSPEVAFRVLVAFLTAGAAVLGVATAALGAMHVASLRALVAAARRQDVRDAVVGLPVDGATTAMATAVAELNTAITRRMCGRGSSVESYGAAEASPDAAGPQQEPPYFTTIAAAQGATPAPALPSAGGPQRTSQDLLQSLQGLTLPSPGPSQKWTQTQSQMSTFSTTSRFTGSTGAGYF